MDRSQTQREKRKGWSRVYAWGGSVYVRVCRPTGALSLAVNSVGMISEWRMRALAAAMHRVTHAFTHNAEHWISSIVSSNRSVQRDAAAAPALLPCRHSQLVSARRGARLAPARRTSIIVCVTE